MKLLNKIALVMGLAGFLSGAYVYSQTFEMIPPDAHVVEQELDPQLDTIATAMMLGAHGVALNGAYADKLLELIHKHVPVEQQEALKADIQRLNQETEAMAIVLERVLVVAIQERGYDNPEQMLQNASREFSSGVAVSSMLIQRLANRIVIDFEEGTFEVLPPPESQ